MMDLKPCPFCPGHGVLIQGSDPRAKSGEFLAYVWCNLCGAKSRTFYGPTPDIVSSWAIDAWNHRRLDGNTTPCNDPSP